MSGSGVNVAVYSMLSLVAKSLRVTLVADRSLSVNPVTGPEYVIVAVAVSPLFRLLLESTIVAVVEAAKALGGMYPGNNNPRIITTNKHFLILLYKRIAPL